MLNEPDLFLIVEANSIPDEVVFEATGRLVREINYHGPFASPKLSSIPRGARGPEVDFGQIGLALLSAGAIKYIAQTLIEFIKKNSRYTIQVGDIKISKDNASERDMEDIQSYLMVIMNKKTGGKKQSKNKKTDDGGAK